MIKNVKVVIGANFGDEGKGLMTDYFASQSNHSIVVRFNGGAQAGHTVVTSDQKRHVFSHFGSGLLAQADTYLSKFFLVNPLLFRKECIDLQQLGAIKETKIFVDQRALLSTPYDMLINQAIETLRGDCRHGSCGLGISETVVRSENPRFMLTVEDMFSENFSDKLKMIRDEYMPIRLQGLGVEVLPDIFTAAASSEGTIESFLADCEFFKEHVKLCNLGILNSYDTIVFEGAQGLLLDQDLDEYSPHITHSSTGLKNVLDILREVNFEYDFNVTYVTRCYLTRHGNGPLPGEVFDLPYRKIVDKTNIPNEWQGSLRFGILDLDDLQKHVLSDLAKTVGLDANFSLAITCLDQVDDQIKFKQDGLEKNVNLEVFLLAIESLFSDSGLSSIYASFGTTRETIKKYVKSESF